MTLKQKERLELKIKRIRATLAAEKRKFGGYDDSRGMRYVPTTLYLKLQDYKGGLVYTRWFKKNFPTDVGFPGFLFEWTVILFMNCRIKEAEHKAVETFFSNTYVFDKFFGRPINPIDKAEYSNICIPEYTNYFPYTFNQPELKEFTAFLSAFEQSIKFKTVAEKFINSRIQLKIEQNMEERRKLVRIPEKLLEEFQG